MDGAYSLDSRYPHSLHRFSQDLLRVAETPLSFGERKFQIPNSKFQINPKLRYLMTQTFLSQILNLDIGIYWDQVLACLPVGREFGAF
jgi:hypothetical protein